MAAEQKAVESTVQAMVTDHVDHASAVETDHTDLTLTTTRREDLSDYG